MANDNIYDIIISEEVARENGTSEDNKSSIAGLILTMDTDPYIGSGFPMPNPITLQSSLTELPIEWEILPDSHIIYVDLHHGSGNEPILPAATSAIVIGEDTNGGTAGSLGNIERSYFSIITVREKANPTNILIIYSDPLTITAAATIHYGYFLDSIKPTNIVDLSEYVISTNPVLPIESNNMLPSGPNAQKLYIAILTTQIQPMAIKDEHGLIADISDWPSSPAFIIGYNLYESPFPMELTGMYTHTFTLIYS